MDGIGGKKRRDKEGKGKNNKKSKPDKEREEEYEEGNKISRRMKKKTQW